MRRLAAENPRPDQQSTEKELDGETGLTYFGARYLDAELGMWTAVDPMGQYHHSYSFVGGNPVNYIDRWGLEGTASGGDNGDLGHWDNSNPDRPIYVNNNSASRPPEPSPGPQLTFCCPEIPKYTITDQTPTPQQYEAMEQFRLRYGVDPKNYTGLEGGETHALVVTTLGAVAAYASTLSGGAGGAGKAVRGGQSLGQRVAAAEGAAGGAEGAVAAGGIIEKGASGAANAANATKLSTQLALEEAGILTAGGKGLTQAAIAGSREIPISGGVLKNPAVVSELTKNGSKIGDWAKMTTKSITLRNGESRQVHFYMNRVTGEVNLNIDFKVKGVIGW